MSHISPFKDTFRVKVVKAVGGSTEMMLLETSTFIRKYVKLRYKNGKTKMIEVNRSVLNSLNSYTLGTAVAVDFKIVLQIPPLYPVPQSICNSDSLRAK